MATISLDKSIIDYLKQLPVREDGMFNNVEHELHNQMQFLAEVLVSAKPARILEIGTNHAFFPYFALCCCPGIRIDTVDAQKNSKTAVDYLNNKLGSDIRFHCKKSARFFKTFKSDCPVDFAWIDGSHEYEVCLNDLKGCDILKVKNVCVDDFRSNINVLHAVFDFYKQTNNYVIIAMSYYYDTRGIIYLKRIDKR